MASALQELRKEAGYRTAPDFAREAGIPSSTYARYESAPDKIPMGPARQLADWFRVPIDVIVGREEIDVRSLRGDVQRRYDGLSEGSKAAVDHFLDYLSERDARARECDRAEEERRYDELAWRYERLWHQGLDEQGELDDTLAFGTAAELRDGFETFVEGRAAARRGPGATREDELHDERRVRDLMAAYDRAHGTSCGRAEIRASYDGEPPAGKGGEPGRR